MRYPPMVNAGLIILFFLWIDSQSLVIARNFRSLFSEYSLALFLESILSQVLQRKTEEAAMATKRLKELLEARKSSARDNSGTHFS